MRRILVTGGLGFIGAHFIRLLRQERPGWEVVNLDKVTYAARLSQDLMADAPGYRFRRGDVCEPADVAAALEGVDAVVHLAAESHVDRSIAGPADFVRTNVLGTQVLLEEVRRRGLRTVLVSTDEVYGDREGLPPADEGAALRPSSPYAASKAGADALALAYHRTYGVPVLVTRAVNNLGPRQYPEKLIPVLVAAALRDEALPLYGDGEQVREWLHVEDHCRALLLVLEEGREGEVYNVGSGEERPNRSVAQAVLRLLGKPEDRIASVPDRPGHDRRYALDSGKIRRELGWRPRHSFAQALAETVAWYARHPSWLAPAEAGRGRP